jgi:hypothetical protein
MVRQGTVLHVLYMHPDASRFASSGAAEVVNSLIRSRPNPRRTKSNVNILTCPRTISPGFPWFVPVWVLSLGSVATRMRGFPSTDRVHHRSPKAPITAIHVSPLLRTAQLRFLPLPTSACVGWWRRRGNGGSVDISFISFLQHMVSVSHPSPSTRIR